MINFELTNNNTEERTFYVITGPYNISIKAKSEEEAIEIAQLHMQYYADDNSHDLVSEVYEPSKVN